MYENLLCRNTVHAWMIKFNNRNSLYANHKEEYQIVQQITY